MKKILLSLTALCLTLSSFSQAELKATQINVFKNGTYFIVKEGTMNLKNGSGTLRIPSAPLQSTFWLTPTRDNKISRVVFVTDTIFTKKPPQSYYDFLLANTGKKIRVLYKATEKDLREVSGILQDMIKSTGLVRIRQQDNSTTFLPLSSILELGFSETPVDQVKMDSLARLAKVYFSGNPASADIKMNYMQAGIQWLPTYNIKIVNDKELQLEMNALVENFAEPVSDADLTLTVGNPTFLYGTKTDPLAYNYLTGLYDTRSYNAAPAPYPVQMYDNAIVTEEATGAGFEYQDYTQYETDGEKTNDLYMYQLGKVSLPFQSKTNFLIFSSKLSYKDVYEVSIADVANYAYYGYNSSDPEKRYDVFHSLMITNSTAHPFTTGPVFVQNENLQPMAQDQIKYTPVSANASIQLSKAGDVVVKNKEEEITRAEGVKKVGKITYNKITIKGVISVENLQDKKIQLNITKNLTAAVTEASADGVITKSGKYSALNPYSTVVWEIPLNGKESKNINYTYEVYVNASTGY